MKKYLCALTLILTNTAALADELTIAVGLWIPPYVIRDESRGIEYDILKETLALAGHTMVPRYVPLARTLADLSAGNVDGIMSTGLKDLPGCYTNSHITYWNYAITKTARNIKINNVADLSSWSVLSFQNAHKYLGDEFEEMAKNNTRYNETADQRTQNKMLNLDRIDVVVGDQFIYQWFSKDDDVTKHTGPSPEVTYHEIFSPSNFQSVFVNQDVCDEFNIALKQLKESGRYQNIVDSYGVTAIDGALVN